MTGYVTDSTLNTLLERIAAIQLSIDLEGLGRIREAYAYAPLDPPNANCPFTVNQVMPSEVLHVTPGLYWPTVEVDMHFCLARWQGDSSFPKNVASVARWYDLIFSTFGAHARLSPVATPGIPDLDHIVDAYLSNWSGQPYRIQFGTTEFIGFTFRLKVRQYLFTTVTG